MGSKIPTNCQICGKLLDNPHDDLSADCGGDCLLCMAEAGDPDCFTDVKQVAAEKGNILESERERVEQLLNPPNRSPEYSIDRLNRLMQRYD